MDGRYWPGGIPSTVRQHPEPIDDFNYEVITQGFRRFIRDKWVPRADESGSEQGFEYEDNQRRKLVESWACAEQAFRESYQKNSDHEQPFNAYHVPEASLRGLTKTTSSSNCYCVASINGFEDHGRMVKSILLQFFWCGADNFQFPVYTPVSTLRPNPASGPITPDNFKMARSVECPDFMDMGMTVDGTIVYEWGESDVLIDDHTLETGLLLMNKSRPHGPSYFSAHIHPQDLERIWGKIIGLGWDLPEAVESSFPSDEPFDLRPPVVDILLPQYEDTTITREDLERDIEQIAPGYLEAEAAGNGFAGEYDIDRIVWDW